MLRELFQAFTRAHNQERPPAVGAGLSTVGAGLFGGANQVQNISTYGNVSWVFAAVSRIAEAVASTEWHLFRGSGNDNRTEVTTHPALSLWQSANPFDTGQEFREMSQQFFELTGEMWWVLVRNGRGVPVEMWSVRPDRMTPIRDRDDYILGYIYQIGSEKIPYDLQDVIFTRRPSPVDPYRGMGPIGSLILDLGSEVEAANFNRAFFRNDATPGGVIQTDRSMSNAEFAKMVERWKDMHQGTSNASRMGFLERAKFVERKFTQRDMQFVQLRQQTRDLVLAAYGIPLPMLGVMEAPSRANAQAAEFIFARWSVKPRLERMKLALNERLLKLFPDRGLHFDFEDPTPNNRELDLQEATALFDSKIITRNESRQHVGFSPVEEEIDVPVDVETLALNGAQVTSLLTIIQQVTQTLLSPESAKLLIQAAFPSITDQAVSQMVDSAAAFSPAPPPFALALGADRTKALNKALTPLDIAERAMNLAWVRRLRTESEGLVAFLEEMLGGGEAMRVTLLQQMIYLKIELSDVQGYDWDWWTKYKDEVIAELKAMLRISIVNEWPQIEPLLADDLAADYAETRGARLLRVDGDLNIVNQTRTRVNSLVTQTIERGDSLGTLQKSLREDFAFSPERARVVSRTETATAQGQGAKQAAVAQGFNEKRWITQGDDIVSEECLANEAQGWIKIGDPFDSGVDTIPQHPNCRCNVRHRLKPATEERGLQLSPLRRHFDPICPTCLKRDTIVPNRDGPGFWCRRCNQAIS